MIHVSGVDSVNQYISKCINIQTKVGLQSMIYKKTVLLHTTREDHILPKQRVKYHT